MNMKKFTVMVMAGALPAMALAEGAVHWGYEGHGGPAHWAELENGNATCGLGKTQSPINFAETKKEKLPAIEFNYQPSLLKLLNNGHTVQVNVADGSSIKIGADQYKLVQYHFHTPSEEQVQGKNFDMVAHLVHKNDAGQLAVVGVLFKKGKESAALKPVWSKLPEKESAEQTFPEIKVNAAQLLPVAKGYYAFEGSLTTPPCSEGVRWMVLKQPVELSAAQLSKFSNIVHHNNARPVQPLNGRVVKESL
jgi:carbonic anhydrase